MTTNSFANLDLHADLIANLDALQYHQMTPIQDQGLPSILAGQDVIAQAKTGSGKTAAFALGVLQKLEVKRFRIQTLVLCPTRELADQVAAEIRRLGRSIPNIKVLTLCGGKPFGPQVGSLEHGAHIVVGTPGRIEDHLSRGTLKLDDLTTLVLDEADRMLDMGFQTSLDAILDQTPDQRQTLLFSATYPAAIRAIAKRVMTDPVTIKVEASHDASSIEQHFYPIDSDAQRIDALRRLLLHWSPQSAVVFCNTKRETQQVADTLSDEGFDTLALHGDLEQRDRDQTLVRFANRSAVVLVATDVAARGLDIDAIDLIVNYHIAHDAEIHTHRIGRTGRAGSKGIACSIYSSAEHYKVALIGDGIGGTGGETGGGAGDGPINGEALPDDSVLLRAPLQADNVTLLIDGGKRQKLRPGDILGALTGKNGIPGQQVGKINIFDQRSYVAIQRHAARDALRIFSHGKLKGRSFRARLIR